jgi:predicted ATPase
MIHSPAMTADEARHYLLKAELRWERVEDRSCYPFSLPAVAGLREIEFHPKVTFIVGENGSGKSTLIEALAIAWGFNPEGGSKNFRFGTAASHSALHSALRLIKGTKRARDGFFLRAESFFNVATRIEDLDREPSCGPRIIESFGGKSLHAQSHGESFLALLDHRLGGKGLYIFDEPEAALSPSRQMSMLARMHDLIAADSQFVIATHSPILMAYPDAWIYQLGPHGLARVDYEDTDHFRVTRHFLSHHRDVLRHMNGE